MAENALSMWMIWYNIAKAIQQIVIKMKLVNIITPRRPLLAGSFISIFTNLTPALENKAGLYQIAPMAK